MFAAVILEKTGYLRLSNCFTASKAAFHFGRCVGDDWHAPRACSYLGILAQIETGQWNRPLGNPFGKLLSPCRPGRSAVSAASGRYQGPTQGIAKLQVKCCHRHTAVWIPRTMFSHIKQPIGGLR